MNVREEKLHESNNVLFIRVPFVLAFPRQVIFFLAADVQR